jgi:hypothetical protein
VSPSIALSLSLELVSEFLLLWASTGPVTSLDFRVELWTVPSELSPLAMECPWDRLAWK